ncbi:hypothetical protein [Lachnoclostridium phytofermentans]|uniref:Uncharacterized protein n=1 Tax=Lachnoclostridium phytofermentans (strain ATCC 700394 / DSM 18823 / ISDg) TaxID=357809 RepID=A9KLH9_LACP7|nr:hypothetical protein [Lachnoclostridium phytofermentans]ABX41308.1 hypothetical protein Cphy_0924 [Lachnoclostridium phytofermentans ISDg]
MFTDNEDLFFAPIIDIEIHYLQQYTSVFDLGNTIVDLQALVSGITRICEDDCGLFLEENPYYKIDKPIPRQEKIKEIILDEVPENNIVDIDKLSKRIEAQFAPEKVAYQGVRAYPTISRKFSRRYKNLIRLNTFSQGSLILDIATSVISGLILKFIERLFVDDSSIQVTINNNIIIINDNDSNKKIVRVKEYNSQEVLAQSRGMTLDQYYDAILSSVEVNNQDIETSVVSLLQKLSNDKILSTQVIYDKKGIKTLTNDIERMRGNLLDVSI